jgi:hypothetical protein
VCGLNKGMAFLEYRFNLNNEIENPFNPDIILNADVIGPKTEQDFLDLIRIIYGQNMLNTMLEHRKEYKSKHEKGSTII